MGMVRKKTMPELESLSENIPLLFTAKSLSGAPHFPPFAKQTIHSVQSRKKIPVK